MFLLSGSDPSIPSDGNPQAAAAGPTPSSGGSYGLSVVGVPRLTVLAANVLHGSLLSDLGRAEGEMEAQEQRWKEEERSREEEEKKQRKSGRKLPLASHLSAIFNRTSSVR